MKATAGMPTAKSSSCYLEIVSNIFYDKFKLSLKCYGLLKGWEVVFPGGCFYHVFINWLEVSLDHLPAGSIDLN